MNGRKAKQLKREFVARIGRAPLKAGEVVAKERTGMVGSAITKVKVDEWRALKRFYRDTNKKGQV